MKSVKILSAFNLHAITQTLFQCISFAYFNAQFVYTNHALEFDELNNNDGII